MGKFGPDVAKFDQAVDGFLLILAFLLLPAMIVTETVHLSVHHRELLEAFDVAVWTIFTFCFFVRFRLAPKKKYFIVNSKLDMLIVLVPSLRIFRVLRLAQSTRVARGLHVSHNGKHKRNKEVREAV